MTCPFCLQAMTPGVLRSRVGATVFRADDAGDGAPLPSLFGFLSHAFGGETAP